MSIKIMSKVFDFYPRGGGEMLLALALADHAHDDGTSVRPGVKRLAKKTRQSERTVQYQLRKMQKDGWLIPVANINGGRNNPTEYRISVEWLMGANIAGVQYEAQKGATDDIKGATDDIKGAIAVAPESSEPSRTIIKPSYGDKSPSPRRKKLPDDFDLTDQRANAAVRYWSTKGRDDLNPQEQFSAFQAHHKAHGKTMADWDSAWQTWYTNAVRFSRKGDGGGGGSYTDGFLEMVSDTSWVDGVG